MSTPSIPTLTLANGASIPQLGFGTYLVAPEDAVATVTQALELGYRHIDTAQMYRNEAEVGHAINSSGIDRSDIFLTTKLNNSNHAPDDARRSFDQSLKDLGTDYVDLFLIHWPLPMHYGGDFLGCWRLLEEFHADGRARAIGVSNFHEEHLRDILAEGEVKPMVNQIEAHPYTANNEVREFSKANGMVVEAWSPLARGKVSTDPVLTEIGAKYGRTSGQVALRWALQRGDVIFPKSLRRERMLENLDLFSFELSDEDFAAIAALDQGEDGRTGVHPNVMDRL
ncbi:MAG: aldo/keto reductase [Actinomycetaceae bacterium]|nr:aldo/keto reductase [Actinomycetaceae bacterium]